MMQGLGRRPTALQRVCGRRRYVVFRRLISCSNHFGTHFLYRPRKRRVRPYQRWPLLSLRLQLSTCWARRCACRMYCTWTTTSWSSTSPAVCSACRAGWRRTRLQRGMLWVAVSFFFWRSSLLSLQSDLEPVLRPRPGHYLWCRWITVRTYIWHMVLRLRSAFSPTLFLTVV